MPSILELVSVVSAAVAAVTGVLVLRRHGTSPLSAPLTLVMFGVAEWGFAESVASLAADEQVKIAFEYASMPGVAAVVAGAVWHATVLSGRGERPSRATLRWLAVEPTLLVLVVVTDPWHRLLFAAIGYTPDGTFRITFGPLFWVHAAYSYGALAVVVWLLAGGVARTVRGQRRLLALALGGVLVPLVASVESVVRPPSQGALDLAPAGFLVTAGVWLWVERFSGDLRAVPLTTRHVLFALTDAVVVLDAAGRVVDANRAGTAHLLRYRPELAGDVIGRPWTDLVAPRIVETLAGAEHRFITGSDGQTLDVRVSRVVTAAGRLQGEVVVIRDVTEVERMRAELSEQALRDVLTGLFNRRHLERVLPEAVQAALADDRPLSVLMVDVDRFKEVNDRCGHAAGDRVLVEVARVLQTGVRPQDVVARTGGDEFVMLLPGVTGPDAAQRAEDLRTRCVGVTLPGGSPDGHVTVSVGVAQLAARGSVGKLLDDADAALYDAKAAGRDMVALAAAPACHHEGVPERPRAQDLDDDLR